MKISIVYQYYQDHSSPGHSLIYELTQHLAQNGHDVSVVSGEIGYMQRGVSNLPWYRRLLKREQDDGVRVIRTFTYSELHRSYFGRLLSFISFSISCPLGLMALAKPEVVFASSPPIFPVFSAWIVCKLRGIPFVLEVRDLWPASAVQMGILRNKRLITIMSWMERLLYNNAVKIIALTEGIRDDICARGWPESKVELVTCGVDFEKVYPDSDGASRIREKYGWAEKKVLMYFGALGEANNIPVILNAAERLRDKPNYLFVLVGDGIKREAIAQHVNEHELTNVQVLPPVSKGEARMYISAADLCLVTLRDIQLFNGAIPTKLIDYMACAKPVLCGIRGEAQRIVEESGAGVVFGPDDDAELVERIVELLSNQNRIDEMAMRGHAYVRSRFSATDMRKRAEAVLLSATQHA